MTSEIQEILFEGSLTGNAERCTKLPEKDCAEVDIEKADPIRIPTNQENEGRKNNGNSEESGLHNQPSAHEEPAVEQEGPSPYHTGPNAKAANEHNTKIEALSSRLKRDPSETGILHINTGGHSNTRAAEKQVISLPEFLVSPDPEGIRISHQNRLRFADRNLREPLSLEGSYGSSRLTYPSDERATVETNLVEAVPLRRISTRQRRVPKTDPEEEHCDAMQKSRLQPSQRSKKAGKSKERQNRALDNPRSRNHSKTIRRYRDRPDRGSDYSHASDVLRAEPQKNTSTAPRGNRSRLEQPDGMARKPGKYSGAQGVYFYEESAYDNHFSYPAQASSFHRDVPNPRSLHASKYLNDPFGSNQMLSMDPTNRRSLLLGQKQTKSTSTNRQKGMDAEQTAISDRKSQRSRIKAKMHLLKTSIAELEDKVHTK